MAVTEVMVELYLLQADIIIYNILAMAGVVATAEMEE